MGSLESILEQLQTQSRPPVQRWLDQDAGDIDIAIDEAGIWYHEGEPINKESLCRLFSGVLWAQDGLHYLVTPAEKLRIRVADVPFIIHQAHEMESHWMVTSNLGDQVVISAENPVELREYQGQWLPYVNIRYDLWARVNRSIYVQWVTQALEQQTDEVAPIQLKSGDYSFLVAQ